MKLTLSFLLVSAMISFANSKENTTAPELTPYLCNSQLGYKRCTQLLMPCFLIKPMSTVTYNCVATLLVEYFPWWCIDKKCILNCIEGNFKVNGPACICRNCLKKDVKG